MGKLVLRLYAAPANRPAHQQAGRLLQQLRRFKARLVRSTIESTGDDAAEVFEFATAALALSTPARRWPCLIRPIIERQERVTRLEAVALLGSALARQPLTHPLQKEDSMSKLRRIRPLALGKFEPEARQLFLLARRLVNGEGPPEELRMSSPLDAHEETSPRNAWGVAGVGVGLEMNRAYPPIEAMVVAAYILFGTDWPGTFKKLRLPVSREQAYVALERHFSEIDRKKSDAIVTIPKPIAISQRPRPQATAISDHHDARSALAPPERPQLTHQPTMGADESTIDASATRVR